MMKNCIKIVDFIVRVLDDNFFAMILLSVFLGLITLVCILLVYFLILQGEYVGAIYNIFMGIIMFLATFCTIVTGIKDHIEIKNRRDKKT